MLATFCEWGFAKREDGKRGFAITLITLDGISVTYIFEEDVEEHLTDLENLVRDIEKFLKLVKGETDIGYL